MSVGFSRKLLLSLAVGTAMLAAAVPAHADIYNFSFSGGSMSGSGYIVVSPAAIPGVPGAEQVTNIVGTFTDSALGLSNATITGLIATGLPSVNADGTFIPPGSPGAGYGFSWDNLFYPGGNSPAVCPPDPSEPPYPFGGGYLDIYGLLFTVATKGETVVVDLWSNGVIPGFGLTYGVGDSIAGTKESTYGEPFSGTSATVNFTPEPGSLVLLGTGALGAVGLIRRRLAGR
jgi:hypothetical protein